MRHSADIMRDVIELDLEQADWQVEVEKADVHRNELLVWGQYICERRAELLRELRASKTREERRDGPERLPA